MATLLREEIRTDAAGNYTAYVYADGHTETNPPGRPLSKEDLQRQRLQAASKADARTAVAAARTTTGSKTTAASRRESAAGAGPRQLMPQFQAFQAALSTMVVTATTPAFAGGLRDDLLDQVHTGTPAGEDELRLEHDLDRTAEQNTPVVVRLPKRGR